MFFSARKLFLNSFFPICHCAKQELYLTVDIDLHTFFLSHFPIQKVLISADKLMNSSYKYIDNIRDRFATCFVLIMKGLTNGMSHVHFREIGTICSYSNHQQSREYLD